MANRHWNPKRVHCLLAFMALAISSTAVEARAQQSANTQDAGPEFPEWCLLPRPPMATPAEKGKRERGEAGRQTTVQRPTSPSNTQRTTDDAQSAIDNGYGGSPTTDQRMALSVPYTEVWERATVALTALKAELTLPSLMPQTPWSSAPWSNGSQPIAERAQNQHADLAQAGKSKVLETGITPGSAVSLTATSQASAAEGSGPQAAAQQAPKDYARAERQDALGSAVKSEPAETGTALDSVVSATLKGAGRPPDRPIALHVGSGLRDPFKLPPLSRPSSGDNDLNLDVSRPPGVRGLLVPQLRLKGVVRDDTTHKMIAVVTDSRNRAYFLREGEAVYNAVVSKIIPDAVYFKENVFDANRQVHFREVVKTLNPAAGEAR